MKHTRFTISLSLGLALVLLTACAGAPVHTDYDRDARFDGMSTFAWLAPSYEKVDDPVLDSELLGAKVRRAVVMTLTSRGYEETAEDAADFLVTYHTSSRERVRDHGVSFGIGFGGFYHRGHHSIIVRDGFGMDSYQEGSLIIDIVDAETKQLVWRGWTRDLLHPRSYTEEAVGRAIEAILERFPPGR